MRTRIALVAIIPVALITVTLLNQAATVQASPGSPPVSSSHRADELTSFVKVTPPTTTTTTTTTTTLPDLRLAATLLGGKLSLDAGATAVAAPPPPPPAPVVVDTVTPAQRAAWDRVAMCEEGGNWQADGPRFSGGLGITRSNWSIYGGLQYAPSAAQATPDQQIMVAERIQAYPPDQYRCSSW